MIEVLEALKIAAAVAAPIASGSGVWAYLSARHRESTSSPSQITTSQADLVTALTAQTKTILEESAKDRRDLKRRVDRQGAKLDVVMAEIADCHERHAECERNVENLRQQIARTVHDAGVATYPHGEANG